MPPKKTAAINDINQRRLILIEELETKLRTREERGTYISKELNNQINRLEKEIHSLTLKHREEIKKHYSASQAKK